jgi:hypothetical protein
MNEQLIPNAHLYAARRQIEIAEKLGSRKDGIVLVGIDKTKPLDLAIKVARRYDLYIRENSYTSAWNPAR